MSTEMNPRLLKAPDHGRSIARVFLLAILASSVLLVLASAFLPLTVYHQRELAQVRLGLPVRFVVQDQSRLTPPLPYSTGLSSPWEFPTRILGAQLLLNVVIVSGVLLLAAVACRMLVRGACSLRGRAEPSQDLPG